MQLQPHVMEVARIDGAAFHLFLDLFVHGDGQKITAVAAFYGSDIDWGEYGVDLENIVLCVHDLRIHAKYIPHRLDSWEPCILFDFEHPLLPTILARETCIDVSVTAGPHTASFSIDTAQPKSYDVAMSVIIKNENRWIGLYLDYYLKCMQVEHVFVYDNLTEDRAELLEILEPYIDRGEVSYIPWHCRWRNRGDRKQIGQPPQEAHTLNRFCNSRWIGFFDVDEFLRIPGRTLPEFMSDFDPNDIDGLSFGIRWFLYQGTLEFAEVGNPLLSFFQSRRDSLGRKRQKLMVNAATVRFLRFHWLEDGKRELPIDDTDIFFHHYYLRKGRFDQGKLEKGTLFDDSMRRFAAELSSEAPAPAVRPKPANDREWIAHVEAAIEGAEAKRSGLDTAALAVDGMCGVKNRHLLNNLCNFDGCHYLEIGSYRGASLSAAMFGNRVSATAIDNWSEFGGPRQEFFDTAPRFRGECEVRVIEIDCLSVEVASLEPCNVFFYDGRHNKRSQYRAIEHFCANFEDYAVLVIDDWNRPHVREGTLRAIQELDLDLIYEKEILLPPEDLAGMPHHAGAHTWWNGVYVAIARRSKRREIASALAKEDDRSLASRAAADPNRAWPSREPVEVIVFSKDRACQLEALLRSKDRFLILPHRTHVLFTASSDRYREGYDELIHRNVDVDWVRETHFKTDLMNLLSEARRLGRHVMFLVDDIIFTRTFEGGRLIELLDADPDVLAVSLRLGEDIRYCHPRNQKTEPPDLSGDLRWSWRDAHPGYWNYPMSVDGNIFRSEDLVDYLAQLPFRNPNTFEARMAGKPLDKPLLACERKPYLVNLALNLVQTTYKNRHGDISAASMNEHFLAGEGIDIAAIAELSNDSCHIEPELRWVSLPGRQADAVRKTAEIQPPTQAPTQARNATASRADSRQTLDLGQIRLFVINRSDEPERREFMRSQLEERGLKPEFAQGTKTTPAFIGKSLAHLHLLQREDLQVPFVIFEDDCQLTDAFETRLTLPAGSDALYLGVSHFGLATPGELGEAVWRGVKYEAVDAGFLRVFNMLGSHGIVYLSEEFRRAALEAAVDAISNPACCFPSDVGLAAIQNHYRVVTPRQPFCYQSERFSENHFATRDSLLALEGD